MKVSRDITFREMIQKLVTFEQKAQEDIVHFPKYQLPEEVDEGQKTKKEPTGVEVHQPMAVQQPELLLAESRDLRDRKHIRRLTRGRRNCVCHSQ